MTHQNKFVAVVKTGSKILRERENNTIFLPFGCEYSIFLKNLNSKPALVKIDIDGKNIGSDLVIQGNSSIELERFLEQLDKGNKFKFIQKTKEIVEHRGDRPDDGFIRIEIRYEKSKPVYTENHHHHHYYYNTYHPPIFSYSSWTYTSDNSTDGSAFKVMNNKNISCCFTASSLDNKDILPDEGITVKGSESYQHFVSATIGDLEKNSDVIVFRLRGTTDKPITVKTKLVCETCGKHNKSNHKYCSKCGTYLS